MIDVSNDDDLAVDVGDLVALTEHVLAAMQIDPETDVSISIVVPEVMAGLHVEWMDEPGPTDVLSFPMDELRPGSPGHPSGPGVLGDVVLCPAVAADQARAAGHSGEHELRILLAHGMLHLLGYDHADPEEEQVMFGLQRRLVEEFEAAPRSSTAGGEQ